MFRYKKADEQKLAAYGFVQKNGMWQYAVSVLDGQFSLQVFITDCRTVHTQLTDGITGEEYVLHRTAATGAFVGKVRAAHDEILQQIAAACFVPEIFRCAQSHAVIDYVREKYGDEPEYLWARTPANAVWRHKDNRKWYGAILTVPRCKLGLDGDEIAEILDLRMDPDKGDEVLAQAHYFPAYHMNKRSWFTVCLDDTLPTQEIYERIDQSFLLTKNSRS